jgi:PKD repeat protein
MVLAAAGRRGEGSDRRAPSWVATRGALLAIVPLLALLAVAALAAGAPNLVVDDSDVALGVRSPTQGASVQLNATVHNTGDTNVSNVTVKFYLDTTGTEIASGTIPLVAAGGQANLSASWSVGGTSAGPHTLIVRADPNNVVTETSEADNEGQLAFDVNLPPTATILVSANTLMTLELFDFNASTSSDPDGFIQSYIWVFDDGTTGVNWSVSHAYADGAQAPGKAYTVTLLVTDDDGGVGSAQVTVRAINRNPVPVADDVTGNTRTPLVFDGAGSSDPDGRIVNASWTFSDGPVLYGLVVLRSFNDDGAFTATFTVRDEDGDTNSTLVSITVNNQRPTPVITTSPTMPFQPNQTVTFDSSHSSDVDGGITNRTWLFPGGVEFYTTSAAYSFAANGTYNVTLLLIDDDGAFAQMTLLAIVGNQTGGGPQLPMPPVARFTASSSTVYTGETVTFDASGSTDDVGIVSYGWDFGDNSSAGGVAVTHAWTSDGVYLVVLNVTDTDANSTLAALVVRVLNRLPVAVIAADPQGAPSFTNIGFDGTGSFDPDGAVLFWSWDFGDGSVGFGATRSHAYTHPGTYLVTLSVTDNDGGAGGATLLVTVANLAPTAVVPADFSTPTFTFVTFDATGSADPDGSIVSYVWNFGDGGTGNGSSVRHRFTTQGVRTVTLTVTDDRGATAQRSLNVTVTNTAPSVQVTGPLTLYTAQSGTFTASASDPDGSVASWRWQWGDATADATTPGSASHAYATLGLYTVRLTVTDNSGATASADFQLRVLNRLPTAVISAPSPPVSIQSKTELSFGSTGSADAESASLQFYWIFGDGQVGTGASPRHTYATAGTYTVILTVVDADGGAASATLAVEVQNRLPTAMATADNTSVQTGDAVAFDGTASSDPDGQVASWLWEFGDGQTSTEAAPTHVYAAGAPGGGPYSVRLTVADNLGAKATATVSVMVANRLPVPVLDRPTELFTGVAGIFRGNASSDPDGLVLNWTWDFGDGAVAYGPQVGHAYAAEGNFTVKLTVTDNAGGQSEVVQAVTVQPKRVIDTGKPGQGPVVDGTTPGFEGLAAVAALLAVGAMAAVGARSRRRL